MVTGPLFLAILLGLLFSPIFKELVYVWINSEAYHHGFFVAAYLLFLAWESRKSAQVRETFCCTSTAVGLILACAARLLLLSGASHGALFIAGIGMIFILFSLTKDEDYKSMIYPSIIVLFAFPIPQGIYALLTTHLQLVVSATSATIISLLDIPVVLNGNLLVTDKATYGVIGACSGIRSLIACLFFAVVFCRQMVNGWRHQAFFVFTVIPITMFVNTIRITTTAYIDYHHGVNIHDYTAYVAWGVMAAILYGTAVLLRRNENADI